MKKKYILSIAILLVLSLALAACGGSKQLTMLTGGTGGTYYPLGGQLATIISDNTDMEVTASASNASADNVADLASGDADIAFTQTDVMANAVEGVNSFKDKPVDNVLALGSLYPETIQIVTSANSGITSVEDLAGKKVSVGAPGSGTYVNAEQILALHGLSMDDIEPQNLSFDESTGGIQDGNIDAAFITAGTPTGSVEGLGATNDIVILSIAPEKIDELIAEYPYYAKDVIPAGTYSSIDEEVTTVAVLAMLAVTDSLSDDEVYEMTKAIYDNAGDITHDKGKLITLESALDGIGIDLHPGAEKYFKEKGLID
ncbi:TAXI family TRAP transporter solute-binding subunit [Ornithinibacillus halotolerans]|uniref:C4-dicarboxylate ABC transporter substrate-binding protein n=1 Tax=Ornithinibacillus halotolerans TaxID=1274357 RepID=A0A916RPC6_9BACI|nr:TAXI family TRAP transporter solute-binding subunit [Ornithinibacillus halotolerans]GGA63263.1 C4-dicarboxylate ABC transporter substrate-binding protein [Ornithinibacillus halotolerans]